MSWRKICGRKWSFRWVIFTKIWERKIWECFRKRDLSKLSSVNHLKSLIMRTDTVIVRLRSGEVGCFSWHTRYLKFCGLSHTILCSLGPPFLKFNVEEISSVTRSSGNANYPSHNTDMISSAFWLVRVTEFKITHSNDPQHTALLKTKNLCLAGLRRLGRKSQTIVTSEMVRFCPEINNVWDDVVSIMGASTK